LRRLRRERAETSVAARGQPSARAANAQAGAARALPFNRRMAIDFVVIPKPAPVPKMAPFPHHYEVRLDARPIGAVLQAPPRPRIVGGAPAEFAGRDDWWSPEHLFLASLNLCLRATFEALARLKQLEVIDYTSAARAVLDRTQGGPAFTWLAIAVDLTVPPAEAERARTLLEKAKEHCIVANTLKVPVQLEVAVNR
jgi:organic hydroperoxide reductase OsmC/OhrA